MYWLPVVCWRGPAVVETRKTTKECDGYGMFTMAGRVSWKTCRGFGSSVRLQLVGYCMKWPRYHSHAARQQKHEPKRDVP